MKKQFFPILAALLCGVGLNTVRAEYPEGAVQGVFTVGEGTQVVFSHGNLRYKKSNGEWRFADHQYDMVGEDNSGIDKATYGGYIDLFGWGTGANPVAYSCTACEATFDMAGNDPDGSEPFQTIGRRNAPMDYEDFTDWGSHAIANGGNQEGLWRTLTSEEWYHLFFVRANHAERFGLGKVNGVQGLIVLPDVWELPSSIDNFVDAKQAGLQEDESGTTYSFPNAGPDVNNYTQNDFNAVQWQAMENNGAVFLPAAGSRAGTDCNNIGDYGFYWSADSEDDATAFSLGFTESLVAPQVNEPRASGQSVRLVQSYNAPQQDGDVNANFQERAFTVNADGGKVYFSQGNLQGVPKKDDDDQPGLWRFAPKQTDIIGSDNSKLHCLYEGWIDMFVYGKEAYEIGYNAFDSNCGEAEDFDSPTRRNSPMGFDEDFMDWGRFPITNGGNVADMWRTMTADEWSYLFFGRENANSLFGFAKVDNVNGLIVLPDDWTLPSGCNFVPASEKMTATEVVEVEDNPDTQENERVSYWAYISNKTESVYGHNTYYSTNQTWQRMEAAGAVFLPAAGMRTKKLPAEVGSVGYYWSSFKDDSNSNNSLILDFNHSSFRPQVSAGNQDGRSVRLVRDVTQETYLLTVKAVPTAGGMVLENNNEITSGEMAEGDTKTLTLWIAEGYEFAGWEITEGTGSTIEAADVEGEWHFVMGTAATTLTAKFSPITAEVHYYVTIEVNGNGYVDIAGTPYYDGDTYTTNGEETITLTAVADNGWNFVKWDDETADAGRTITVNADMTVTAKFEENAVVPVTHTLTVVVDPANSGKVYKTGADEITAPVTMAEGATIDLTAQKAAGYDFVEWKIGENSVGTDESYTFTMGTEDVTLVAVFEPIPEHVHKWGAPAYSWNGLNCTAERVCELDHTHIETETVTATLTSTTAPTCTEAGVNIYTAVFTNTAFAPQTTTTEIPALGHDWKEPVYTWSADHTTCTATRECGNDASHNIVEVSTATVTTEGGVTTYTATFTNSVFKTQTYTYVPAASITVTMSEYGFLSLYADKAYIVPSGLKAYIYTGISGRNLTYKMLNVIPAYTGVFFEGNPNTTYTLYETTTTATYPENMLSGRLTEEVVPNDGNVHYILTRLEGTNKGGLYWPKGTVNGVGAFTCKAGKAYLTIPASAGVAPRYFTLRGQACEEVTAVDEVEADGDGRYYDVLGREVRDPQPQQIYIRKGQKVLYIGE